MRCSPGGSGLIFERIGRGNLEAGFIFRFQQYFDQYALTVLIGLAYNGRPAQHRVAIPIVNPTGAAIREG